MKLSDVPKSQSLNFGLNSFKFDSFVFEDSQYGRQVKFVFTRPGKDGEDFTQQTWFKLYDKTFDVKEAWKMTSKLDQFKDVLAVVDDNVDESYQALCDGAPDFDENDVDSIIGFQEKFITKILEQVVGKEVNVVMHYTLGKDGNWYLNIPSYKDNNYQLAFGKNPPVYAGLNDTKGQSSTTNTESTNSGNSGW